MTTPLKWCGALVMAVAVLTATSASGALVGSAVPLEDLAKSADLVCKATVVADRAVTDAWFEPIPGYEVRETELRIVSIVKGALDATRVKFRHYHPEPNGIIMPSMPPPSYRLMMGRSYLVLASKTDGDVYRQLAKQQTRKRDQGVIPAADDAPHRGTTITQAAWAELRGLLASTADEDVVYAIEQLDEMSGGRTMGLNDFERRAALGEIRPLILARPNRVATAAIEVFGFDSPYFDNQQAANWLAGLGKGTIPGLAPRTPGGDPEAFIAATELISVADGPVSPDLRARAIRALGRAAPASRTSAWLRDPAPVVRSAAVLVSAAFADRAPIASGARDGSGEVRVAAARAIGFSQDPALLPTLNALLTDGEREVRSAAALSLLSFAIDQAGVVMKAHLDSDYRPVFVNALARANPQPYLPQLAEVIEKRMRLPDGWSGMLPSGDSWSILFAYVKSRPATELTAGTLDRSLDALEKMAWFSSSEPRDLYALYLRRGLPARARNFRDAVNKSVAFDMNYYFDMADKNPSTYVP